MAQIVVVNQFGEFVADTGQEHYADRYRFVEEYPDAEVFETASAAKRAVKAMKATKQYCATWYLVAHYGMANETRVRA